MGGQIQKVDMVRDQLALKVPAGHIIKILFDERTQVFQNGKQIPMLQLHPEDHASIETTLDGTKIYALRIHMLSNLPSGELRGKVESYDLQTGELRILLNGEGHSIKLVAPTGTPVARVGQASFVAQKNGAGDLIPGSIVDVFFSSGVGHAGNATRIDVLAVPGAQFVFQGSLTSLNLHSGRMTVEGNADRPVDIAFEPGRFDVVHDLHRGSQVKVTANFDGNRYTASKIVLE